METVSNAFRGLFTPSVRGPHGRIRLPRLSRPPQIPPVIRSPGSRPPFPRGGQTIFRDELLPQLRLEYPNLSLLELDVAIFNLWQNLSQAHRDEYYALFPREEQRYLNEMSNYAQNRRLNPDPNPNLPLPEPEPEPLPEPLTLQTQLERKILLTDPEPEDICPICLINLTQTAELGPCVKLTNSKCQHKFHKKCILEWGLLAGKLDTKYRPTIQCPLCRALAFGKRRRPKSHKRSRRRSKLKKSRPRRRKSKSKKR